MRESAVAWLIELCAYAAEHPQTVHHAVRYFDRFVLRFSTGEQGTLDAQLIASGAFLIACKMLEVDVMRVEELSRLTMGACTDDAIRMVELVMVEDFKWRLNVETPHHIIPFLCNLVLDNSPGTNCGAAVEQVSRPLAAPKRISAPRPQAATCSLFADEELGSDNDDLEPDVSSFPAPQKPRTLTSLFKQYSAAFADLALYSPELQFCFSVGEVAAASILLASHCAEYRINKFLPGPLSRLSRGLTEMWSSYLDKTGIRRAAVYNACIELVRTWEHVLFVSVSVPWFARLKSDKLTALDVCKETKKTFSDTFLYDCDRSWEILDQASHILGSIDVKERGRIDSMARVDSKDGEREGHISTFPAHWSASCALKTARDTIILHTHSVLSECTQTLWQLIQSMPTLINLDVHMNGAIEAQSRRTFVTASPLSCAEDKENMSEVEFLTALKPRRSSSCIAARKRLDQSRSASSPPRKRPYLGSISNFR